MHMSVNVKVHIALFLVSALYGATFTIAKEVMPQYIHPFAFILLRVSVAAICLFFFHRFFIKEKIRDTRDYLKLLLAAVFGVAANMLLFFKGLALTKPINGAVLMLNTPVFVSIIAAVWFSERLGWIKWSGIILSAVGAVMLVTGFHFQFNQSTAWGDLMVSLNAVIYAFYLVYAKSLMKKYHPVTVTLYCFVFGWFIVLPFGAQEFKQIHFSELPLQIWIYVIFITFGATFLTYVLNAYALRHASSSLVGSYIFLQPVLATLIAVISGRDALDIQRFICMLLVFAGVYITGFVGNRKAA